MTLRRSLHALLEMLPLHVNKACGYERN